MNPKKPLPRWGRGWGGGRDKSFPQKRQFGRKSIETTGIAGIIDARFRMRPQSVVTIYLRHFLQNLTKISPENAYNARPNHRKDSHAKPSPRLPH